MKNTKTPKQGLEILENLQKQHPHHQGIRGNLVHHYINLGLHDKAMAIINKFYGNLNNIESLKFQAWVAHKQGDLETEQQLWDRIADNAYYAEYHGILGSLFALVDKEIVLTPDDIPLFSVQRNEILRLPCFLDYYRKLGVTKFFFTDNNSDDGSFEYLLAQPDCYVFWTKDSHLQAGAGMVWNQYLIQKYVLDNQWYLVIDADELLVYPNCETFLLPTLIDYLNQENYDAVASYVLDMFPKNQQEQLNIQSGDNLIEKSPYFYNHYIFNHQIESPYHKVEGGIFYVFGQNIPLNVTPLLKKRDPYIKLLSSRHLTTPTKIADVTSCLLHFKFVGDFYKKSLDETKRKQHWGGGIAYKRYMQFFDEVIKDDFNFTDLEKTTKYENSTQLVGLGLIKSSHHWKNFSQNKKKHCNQGLIILEKLHQKHPKHQGIQSHLINTYIKLGYHDKAIMMITNSSNNNDKRFQAWLEHKNGNIDNERQIWKDILSNGYYSQIHAKINNFILKSEQPKLVTMDIPLFCVQRNEMLRLPEFLDYYRKLGVTKFIFIDNNSDDGSLEFLLSQPDCYVYWTDDSYLQSAHGLTWLNYLINETDILHLNQWYIIADVDELLVYPNCENFKLPILIDYLNQENSEAVASFMLDMYADNLLCYHDEQFIDEHIYFYNNYQTFYQVESPYIKIAGGIRNYLFSEYNDYHVKTALFKKLSHKSFLISSTHQTTPYKISKLTTVFKHYKFVNLKETAKQEIQRKQHSDGGSRYRHYHNHLENNDNIVNFLDLPKTTKYENSQQLVDLGLIASPDEWSNFTTNKRTPKQGLEILENLYKKHSNHQVIKYHLIDSYIRFGHHDKAISMINELPKSQMNVQTLQWRAWVEHKNGNIDKEKQLWQIILNKRFFSTIYSKIYNFNQRSNKNIDLQKNDIVLISIVHNEILRLPFFLKHYRNLGVTQFFFVDNNSDDGSLEFLLSQPDCHVFWTDDSFDRASFGMHWAHYLLDNYIPENQWCIQADADEFLVYPHYETHKLPKLIQYLDKYGYDAIGSFMLDMYPKDINSQLNITADDDLIKASPYFYNNYQLCYQQTSPYIRPIGGIFQYYDIYDRRTKTSVFKTHKDFYFLIVTHESTPTKIADITSAYFHFKMIGDFYKKAIQEQERKQHSTGGLAYKQYAKMYESFNGKNFDFTTLPKTTKYENSQQLVDLGLIQTSQDWEIFTQVKNIKTPSRGLSILENLYQKHSNHEGICNNLINFYIRFNYIDKAKKMIEQKPVNYHNLQSLNFHAWLAHQNNNSDKELEYWLAIFDKNLNFLSKQEREYLLSQAITNKEKISLCKENWNVLFNYAHSSLPVKLQNLLGNTIKNVVLIANNHEITLEHLSQHIQKNDLIVCFNHNIFLNFYEHFPHNSKLLFFRKENPLNYNFLGLPNASLMHIDIEKLYDIIRQPFNFMLFNEHLPHTLDLPYDIYYKIYNPQFTGIISQFHRIFHYMQPPNFYFHTSWLTPTSGFMVLKYLYYTRLHLLNLGKPSFNIKLLGFNFTNNSFYPTHGTHNWEYERSQQENLPDSIHRIIVP